MDEKQLLAREIHIGISLPKRSSAWQHEQEELRHLDVLRDTLAAVAQTFISEHVPEATLLVDN